MVSVYDILKSHVLRHFPDAWLAPFKARHYYRMLENFDVNDEPDMTVLPALVAHGSMAIDLGANVGVYTKILSGLVGPSGQVLSVEPVPQTFKILRENVRRLRLSNVSLIEAAVSDSVGTATMTVPEYATGGLNFYESQIVADTSRRSAGPSQQVTVQTRTLDSLVSETPSVSFIKCDVEGHESAVIAGASGVLIRQRPAWLIEISENPDVAGSSARLFARLKECGYEPWFFDRTNLRCRRPGDRSTNYFFLTAEHIERVQANMPRLILRS